MAENDNWRQIVRRAWNEAEFKQRLLTNPREVLAEYHMPIQDGVTYVVIEDQPDRRHLVLPPAPSGELRVDDFGRDVESGDPGF